MKNRPIVVMAAMKVEAEFLIQKLENTKITQESKYTFYEGTVNNYPVVVGICHVMSLNCAIATYIAIQKYDPKVILIEGTAGAHGKDIHKGDIVIGEKCININSFKSPNKAEGEGSIPFEWELKSFFEGEDDRLDYKYGDSKLVEIAKKVQYSSGKVHCGTIGSGDGWNNESDRILWLNKKYGTLCEDMESISAYTLANDFNIPVLGIRIVSNNEILREPYDRNTGLKSQEFTYELIEKLIQELL